MSKVLCLYNKYFFELMLVHMLQNKCETVIDAGCIVWHKKDVLNIIKHKNRKK